jgi:hypothetical protein
VTEPNTNWAQPEGGSSSPAPAPTPAGAPSPSPAGAPSPAPVVVPKKKGGNLTNVLLVVAAVIAIGGVAFAVGRATAPTATASGFRGGNGQFPGGQGIAPNGSFAPGQGVPGGFGGDRALTISGTVKSIDGTTMTITTADGTETTVDITDTTYHSQAAATAADVKAGSSVAVEVTGFGGFRGRPDASAGPDASGAPGAGTGTVKASDVTIKAN